MKLQPMSRVNKIIDDTKSMFNPILKTKGFFEDFGIDH